LPDDAMHNHCPKCGWSRRSSVDLTIPPPCPVRVVCHEHRLSKWRCVTVREMKEGPSCARINPEKGERECDLKPFVAVQRVQLPPGKGEPASRKRALHGWWQHHS